MAETVALTLKSNGKQIEGSSTQTSLGRDKTIECLDFWYNVTAAREASTGMATGRRLHDPIWIQKRIDKSSPLIAKAMTNHENIEGKFAFFRPNPSGDGTTEQFYTIEITKGRVAAINQTMPDQAEEHPLEEVEFTFENIKWTWTDGGVSHEDTWSAPK